MSSGNSFPKDQRLLTRFDFSSLRRGANVHRSASFLFIYKEIKDRPYSRLGMTVSAKVGKAHYRNRLKRSLRECYRVSKLKNSSFDFLVIAHKGLSKKLDAIHLPAQIRSEWNKFEESLS